MKKNKKFKLAFFATLGTGVITTTVAAACSSSITADSAQIDYSFVSLGANLSGNLVTLGYLPTVQSLYNNETIPSYVGNLNIATEYGNQPASANAETWLSRDPQSMYGNGYQKPASLATYGLKNFISQNSIYSVDLSSVLPVAKNDEAAKKSAWAWDLKSEMLDLASNLNENLKTKTQTSIFGTDNGTSLVTNIYTKFQDKITSILKELDSQNIKNPKISFWGKSYGPVWVNDATAFNEYGPNIQFPGWLYTDDITKSSNDSLSFQPAIPTDTAFKFSKFIINDFGVIGWLPSTGAYSANTTHQAFQNSSDYVFVALTSNLNTPENVEKVKNIYKDLVSASITDDTARKQRVFIIQDEDFTLAPYNMLGSEYSMDVIINDILGANRTNSLKAFDTSNLKLLSKNNYDFVAATD